MKAAIYNQFWHSMGGGERHSAMIAEILSRQGVEVDLVGHTDVSVAALSSRLGLDLSGTTLRVVPDLGEESVAELSADYDLFVNATYMSRVKPRAKRNAYLCFFPTPHDHDLSPVHRMALRVLGPHVQLAQARLGLRYGKGWFPPEGGRRRQWAWSNGAGRLSFDAGELYVIRADFGRPGAPDSTEVVVEADSGVELARFTVTPQFSRQTVEIPAAATTRHVTIRSETFSPGPGDRRQLGVAMSRLRHVGAALTPAERIGGRFPWLTRNPNDLTFIPNYDVILANSDYTKNWIVRRWGTSSEVLYPPIQIREIVPAVQREKIVLSVGRFFAPGYGHSKRQLEMVQMFGRLIRSGQLDGWRMAVVGGCEDEQLPYLRQVQRAAEGLPIDIHANAPRSLVTSLMSTAAIFWSATGLREDTEKRPWTNEHFGMTTAEAMVGGCVPVVIDRAGQREIVRQAVDGFRWNDEAQLRIRTIQVATDEALRARLAASAQRRVTSFSEEAFADRWNELAGKYDLLPGLS
jgi:glycosyltransferase involved in cell wall biosynthesis